MGWSVVAWNSNTAQLLNDEGLSYDPAFQQMTAHLSIYYRRENVRNMGVLFRSVWFDIDGTGISID